MESANKITAKTFEEKTGFIPVDDDLERASCPKAGELGHQCCGWCKKHDGPMTQCLCAFKRKGNKD